jgi:type I restriction enzyme S subunit
MCVEALIDNKLAEQQLNLAQQALDCGDNSQDRDILSRLTTKGFDVDGDPLFPDLDQLYDLLTLSQEIME